MTNFWKKESVFKIKIPPLQKEILKAAKSLSNKPGKTLLISDFFFWREKHGQRAQVVLRNWKSKFYW